MGFGLETESVNNFDLIISYLIAASRVVADR